MSAETEYWERDGRHASVAAAWVFEAGTAQTSLVSADGCFDFIVRATPRGGLSAFLYAPVTAAHWVHIDAGERMFGVRVLPGYGGALMRSEPELRRLAEHDADDTLLERLEALVVSAVTAAPPPDVVREFVSLARASEGRHRLTSPTTGGAERELQRASGRWLGLSPKRFLRIERAWAARRAIREGQPLAAVAAALGYADQAHLTRDVHHLLGVTPRELRPVGILQDPRRPRR
jgi:AraC-like DNA-binding protein